LSPSRLRRRGRLRPAAPQAVEAVVVSDCNGGSVVAEIAAVGRAGEEAHMGTEKGWERRVMDG
jgi:hypothetical protein